MKKRTLLLLASAVLVTGMFADESTVQARTVLGTNGAIIRQLPRTNTDALKQIMSKYSTPDKRFDRQAAIFDYYDRNHRYIEADMAFNEFIGMIKDLDGKAREKEIAKWTPFIEEGINDQPNNARRHYQKSVWERNFGSNEKAFEAIKHAVALDFQNINYRYEYAQFALDYNDYDKAIEIYTALKKGYPHDVDYRIALAKAYSQAGQYDKAIHEYRVASAFEPGNNETVIALNEAVNAYYSEMGGQNFYDPMTNVAYSRGGNANVGQTTPSYEQRGTRQVSPTMMALSASGTKNIEQEVDENQPSQSKYAPVDNRQMVNASNRGGKKMPNVKEATQRRNLQYSHSVNSGNYRPQPAPRTNSNKRILVTYVNGRRVVRIVNVNTENDSMNAVQNASATFENQLENTNSSYEEQDLRQRQQSNTIDFAPSETEYTQPSTPSQTTSKYQTANTTPQSGEIGTRTTIEGDPSVKSLTNSQNRRPVMYVSYQNGKRVIRMVNPNSTALGSSSAPVANTQSSQTVSSTQTQKVEKQKEKKVKQDKKQKKNKASKADNKPITSSQENTDMYIRANELLTQEDYRGTIQVLEGVNPPTLRSLTIIASCYSALGQPQTAIEYYNRADSMSPNNTQILYSLAYLYYTKGDIQQAKKYVDAAIAADPQNANAQQLKQHLSLQDSNEVMNQAVTYMNQGEYANAKKLMEKVVASNPNDFQAYYYLGHIAYATEKYEESTRNFMMAIKNNPNYALSYYSLGLAYDKLREYNRSQLAYEQFLKMELDENKYTQYAKTRVATIQSKK